MVIERIFRLADALYHTAEHTALADHRRAGYPARASPPPGRPAEMWMHVTLPALAHPDIGYVRGICQGDTPPPCVFDEAGATIELLRAHPMRFRRLTMSERS